MDKLKPCPFCGSEVEVLKRGNDHTKKRSAFIHCKKCNTKMEVGAISLSHEWAIDKITEKWNTRHDAEKDKAIEVLADALCADDCPHSETDGCYSPGKCQSCIGFRDSEFKKQCWIDYANENAIEAEKD